MMQNYKEKYQQLLIELERLGGKIQGVYSFYSLENEAKVRQEIKRLQSTRVISIPEKPLQNTTSNNEKQQEKSSFSELIASYPPALHSVFFRKKDAWLKACSLKIQLNQLQPTQEEKARVLQFKIWKLFEQMDTDDIILEHWKKHKRILTEEEEDFSNLSPVELVQKRNTLRSNIVSREKSLQKWIVIMETNKEKASFTLKEKIIRKTEELKQLKMKVKKLNELIK